MKIKRREFLKRSALGVSGVLAGVPFAGARQVKPGTYDPFGTVQLGPGKLEVSRLCMGTGVHGGNRESNQTRMGSEKFEALLKGGYDRGVRLFDLADLYG